MSISLADSACCCMGGPNCCIERAKRVAAGQAEFVEVVQHEAWTAEKDLKRSVDSAVRAARLPR